MVESNCDQLCGCFMCILFWNVFWVWFTDGNISIAPFLPEAAAEVVVAAVHGAGAAFTGYEVVAVFGFDFVTADIAADRVADDHSCSSSSCFSFTPIRTPSIKPDRW